MNLIIKNINADLMLHQASIIEKMAFTYYDQETHQEHLEVLAIIDCLRDALHAQGVTK